MPELLGMSYRSVSSSCTSGMMLLSGQKRQGAAGRSHEVKRVTVMGDSAETGDREQRKKQKKAKDKTGFKYEAVDPIAKVNALPEEKIQEIRKAIGILLRCQGPAKSIEEATRRSYLFWDTQPVPKIGETVTCHGSVVPDTCSIRQEPYCLPQGFSWDSLDLDSPGIRNDCQCKCVVTFSPIFFLPLCCPRALRPPGWLPQWHCGVRVASNRKLVGFIGATPLHVRVYHIEKKMVEIKFLCVHKKLRKKRLAPVLIREISRRVNLEGIFQAIYTAGVVLPTPVASCRYWHRYLNPRKLIELKFSPLSKNMTMQRALKLYRLPETPGMPGLRPMTLEDVPAVHRLLSDYLGQFHLVPLLSAAEVEHWLLPQNNIIDTYVVESEEGSVTDFVSFTTRVSSILKHPVHHSMKAAYSFYTVHTKTPLVELIHDALILAKSKGFDVFSALDLMENKTFLENLKFVSGEGNVHHYLYNWKCPSVRPEKVGFLLP
ncbi:glycylpeptide N-tetradecanoyltransferase 1-like isoform X2 [Arapaima gigas]